MSVNTTFLFDRPQREVARHISETIERASSLSIVTGFATPGGLAAIGQPIRDRPSILKEIVLGAATYNGFEALDDLLSFGVNPESLWVHLGHTTATGGRKNPFARFHPMLHSKIYYIEAGNVACAFVGSHNVTAFALGGLNGEAAVLLEGPIEAEEFVSVRQHIAAAKSQATAYMPSMKTAYAWWVREFMEGLKAEIGVPIDWSTVRTILLFVASPERFRPKIGEHLYFEIPAGIEQIESLKTEVHMFMFDSLPSNPIAALGATEKAFAKYTCTTLGAENRQGNLELAANWQIELAPTPVLRPVPGGRLRPKPPAGMQQVRAEVSSRTLLPWDYQFERETVAWDPVFEDKGGSAVAPDLLDIDARIEASARGGDWRLVKGLRPRAGVTTERDAAALKLATPESGSFILVSLRRRKRGGGSTE